MEKGKTLRVIPATEDRKRLFDEAHSGTLGGWSPSRCQHPWPVGQALLVASNESGHCFLVPRLPHLCHPTCWSSRKTTSDTNSCRRTIPHEYIAIICLCSWQQVRDSLHGLLALLLSWDPTIDSREEAEPPVESTPQKTEWTSRLPLRMRTS